MRLALSVKNKIALLGGKLVLKILSEKSTSAPGLLASRLSSNLLHELLASVDQAPIFVTGTNGKSTTAGFLASILTAANFNFAHNRSGANLQSGLLTTLIKKTNLNGKVAADEALLEIDEAVLRRVSAHNPAKLILVNNFFRDQLDRFGEMEQTIKLVKEGINLTESGLLVINADDPNVCKLALSSPEAKVNKNKIITFGISPSAWPQNKVPEIFAEELANCPTCGEDLKYKSQWLGQFGDFYCTHCNYQKPPLDVQITALQMNTDFSEATVKLADGKSFELKIPLPGLFNVYNALAALAAAYGLHVLPEHIIAGIKNYQSLFGRSQEVVYRGKRLKLFLIKNPIGASEVLRLISTDPKAKVLIAINDDYADGRDVSWLWDAHFEYLANNNFPVYATGKRGSDMAVRLKYAGAKRVNYCANLKQAIDELCEGANEEDNLYVLPTYTALLKLTDLMGLGKG